MNREQRRHAERMARKGGNDGEEVEVPIGMRVGGDFKSGRVLLQFNRPVTNLNLQVDGAKSLASALTEWADKVSASADAEAKLVEPSRIVLLPGARDQ